MEDNFSMGAGGGGRWRGRRDGSDGNASDGE